MPFEEDLTPQGDKSRSGGASTPPPTPAEKSVTTLGTLKIERNYHWVTKVSDPKVVEWIGKQNAATDRYFSSLPETGSWMKSIRELLGTQPTVGITAGGNRFSSARPPGQNRPVIKMTNEKGEERTLIDFNQSTPFPPDFNFSGFLPSPDGKRLAVYAAPGNEMAYLKILDVQSGKFSSETLKNVPWTSLSWAPDGDSFLYSRHQDLKGTEKAVEFQERRAWRHTVGTPQSEDTLVFGEHLPSNAWSEGKLSPGGEWGAFLSLYVAKKDGAQSAEIFVQHTSWPEPKRILGGEPKNHLYDRAFLDDETLIVLANDKGGRGRVLSVALDTEVQIRELIPEPRNQSIQNVIPVGDKLLVHLVDSASHLKVYDREGKELKTLTLPDEGRVRFSTGETKGSTIEFSFSSFRYPTRIYQFNAESMNLTLMDETKTTRPIQPENYTVTTTFGRSKDGTLVPVTLMHKKGVSPSGDVPVQLNVYGGFGEPQIPAFLPLALDWVERGGVYALAVTRGDGNFGRRFHDEGRVGGREKTIQDTLAATEQLISLGWHRNGRIAIRGASNGGLTVENAVLRRPDLYGAAVAAIPVLDLTTVSAHGIGSYYSADYGSPTNPTHLKFMEKFSPVLHVENRAYPPTYLIASPQDARVGPSALEMAAELQQKKENPGPVLLEVNMFGHASNTRPANSQTQISARIGAFLWHELMKTK